MCLLAVVLAAVVIGLLWYLSVPREQSKEGFLIQAPARQESGEEVYGL